MTDDRYRDSEGKFLIMAPTFRDSAGVPLPAAPVVFLSFEPPDGWRAYLAIEPLYPLRGDAPKAAGRGAPRLATRVLAQCRLISGSTQVVVADQFTFDDLQALYQWIADERCNASDGLLRGVDGRFSMKLNRRSTLQQLWASFRFFLSERAVPGPADGALPYELTGMVSVQFEIPPPAAERTRMQLRALLDAMEPSVSCRYGDDNAQTLAIGDHSLLMEPPAPAVEHVDSAWTTPPDLVFTDQPVTLWAHDADDGRCARFVIDPCYLLDWRSDDGQCAWLFTRVRWLAAGVQLTYRDYLVVGDLVDLEQSLTRAQDGGGEEVKVFGVDGGFKMIATPLPATREVEFRVCMPTPEMAAYYLESPRHRDGVHVFYTFRLKLPAAALTQPIRDLRALVRRVRSTCWRLNCDEGF